MSLGRGLNALITSTGGREKKAHSTDIANGKVWDIPLSAIELNPDQPRKTFNPGDLAELSESIKKHGILQPVIVVEKTSGGYELVAGERRYRAAKLAGFATVPALVKEMADQEKLEVALIENIQRADLNAVEEAFAYKRLMEEFGLTQQDVAEKVGKSRPAVANAVRLLDLPEEVQTALVEGKINTGQARALLSLDSREQQLATLSSMLGERITVRELERAVARKRAPDKSRRDPNLMFLEDKIRGALGTKVAITQKGERGVVSLSYYSKEELKRLVDKICG